MKYRKMGSLGWDVSSLGFGTMRLPCKRLEHKPDYEESIKMIRHAVDNGINYIDTAWIYHDGQSEYVVGKALSGGYRNKVKLVTKSPVWLITSPDDFISYLDQQLKKLNTDFLDIYLLHGLNRKKWQKVKSLGLLQIMEKLKSQGKIRHIGFSFHDSYETFKEIIDSYPWDMTLIQYNYLDTDYEVTREGLNYAYAKKIAVAIMEPLHGGKLVQSSPEIDEIINSAPVQRTLAEWAFKFIWNHPGVSTVLSGMSTMDQLKENLQFAERSESDILSGEELNTIEMLKNTFKKKIKISCTNCQYCMPCPHDVDIPENFALLNHAAWEGKVKIWMKNWYDEMNSPDISTDWHGKGQASLCIQCNECLEKCPQKINIPDELEYVTKVFEQGESL